MVGQEDKLISTVMLNEVKHLYNKDSSLPLRLRSGLKAQNDS